MKKKIIKVKKVKVVARPTVIRDIVEETAKETVKEIVKKADIGALVADFGREDMNGLRDKVNEIIAYLNATNR